MASDNHVSSRTPKAFGYYKLASASGVSLATNGNAIVAMPILGGGLSDSGATITSGAAIIRRITVSSFASGNLAAANVSIGTSNDGANLYANAQTLTNITANSTYADLILSATANVTPMSGHVSSTLYVNLVTGAVANSYVDIAVYGDVLNP